MEEVRVQPIADRICVKLDECEEEEKRGGIFIPDNAKDKPQTGTVLAVGTGKIDADGKTLPFNVKVGDRVWIPKYGYQTIKIPDGDKRIEYHIVKESDLLAIEKRKDGE